MGKQQITRLMKKCKNKDAFDISLAEATTRRKYHRQALRAERDQATQWRRIHLEGLAAARATANDSTQAGELKSMREREKSREKWRRIAIMRRKNRTAKVTKLYRTVPVTDNRGHHLFDADHKPLTKREECNSKQEMEHAVMAENETRFTRCIDSVFFDSILFPLFGMLCQTPAAQQVRTQSFLPPQRLDPFATEFLTELQVDWLPVSARSCATHISAQENSNSWKHRQPGTSSEPSQLSFAHHIVAAHSDQLSEVDAALRSAPYELGFSAIDWQHITDFQILKKPDVYDVEKMRTIALMPALFNENNKKLARDSMRCAEAAGAIPPEQFGGRKGMRAAVLALEKVLSFDIIRQQVLAAIHAGIDAKECYDRMAHQATALSMEKMGSPQEPVTSMFETLQQAEHKVTTAYGVSDSTYGGKQRTTKGLFEVQSIGQGNGAGPYGYTALSANAMAAMRRKGYGALYVACISLISLMRVCMSFVDDSDIGVTANTVQETRNTLEFLGHTQPATPIQTDNSCAEGICNDTVKQKRSKVIDMRFYWIRDRVRQGQFIVHWKAGRDNLGDYYTKHFPASHHRRVRPAYLHEQANSLSFPTNSIIARVC